MPLALSYDYDAAAALSIVRCHALLRHAAIDYYAALITLSDACLPPDYYRHTLRAILMPLLSRRYLERTQRAERYYYVMLRYAA